MSNSSGLIEEIDEFGENLYPYSELLKSLIESLNLLQNDVVNFKHNEEIIAGLKTLINQEIQYQIWYLSDNLKQYRRDRDEKSGKVVKLVPKK